MAIDFEIFELYALKRFNLCDDMCWGCLRFQFDWFRQVVYLEA